MEENLLALLEKSNLFSFNGLNPFKAEVEIRGMRDFKFFLCNCFSERNLDDSSYLKGTMTVFLKHYLENWTKIMEEKPGTDLDWWKDYSKKTFGFLESFDWKDIFNRVKSGREIVDLIIKPNNSEIVIKRFGNILVFNVLNLGNKQKKHLSGLRAVKSLCRAEDASNNQGVYEIIHEIQICLSIPMKRGQQNECTFDFDSFFTLIEKASPWAGWNLNSKQLVDYYTRKKRGNLIVGQFFGFNVSAELIHDEKKENILENSEDEITTVWRRGNVGHVEKATYKFIYGKDIFLKLILGSSLPNSLFKDADEECDFHREQFKIAEVGAIFCAQLCALQLSKFREYRVSIGD